MRRGWMLAATLALTGCFQTPDKPMPDAQCRQSVYEDPLVKQRLEANAVMAGFGVSKEDRDDLAYARNDAYARCMRLRGLAPPGGVEAVRPPR